MARPRALAGHTLRCARTRVWQHKAWPDTTRHVAPNVNMTGPSMHTHAHVPAGLAPYPLPLTPYPGARTHRSSLGLSTAPGAQVTVGGEGGRGGGTNAWPEAQAQRQKMRHHGKSCLSMAVRKPRYAASPPAGGAAYCPPGPTRYDKRVASVAVPFAVQQTRTCRTNRCHFGALPCTQLLSF